MPQKPYKTPNFSNGAEFLSELEAHAQLILAECGVENSEQISHKLTEHLIHTWNGTFVYVPIISSYEKIRRNNLIKKEFTGNNHKELAKKYNLSLAHVYKLLRYKKS